MRDNLGEKYLIEKGNANPGGEIVSPFPLWGNLYYPCIGQFHQIVGTRWEPEK